MYVCLCKSITDRQIRETVQNGANSFAEVRRELGVSTQCGKCGQLAKSIVDTAIMKKTPFESAA